MLLAWSFLYHLYITLGSLNREISTRGLKLALTSRKVRYKAIEAIIKGSSDIVYSVYMVLYIIFYSRRLED
jgi:hypothetical protein